MPFEFEYKEYLTNYAWETAANKIDLIVNIGTRAVAAARAAGKKPYNIAIDMQPDFSNELNNKIVVVKVLCK